jgi:hypothetical protein
LRLTQGRQYQQAGQNEAKAAILAKPCSSLLTKASNQRAELATLDHRVILPFASSMAGQRINVETRSRFAL